MYIWKNIKLHCIDRVKILDAQAIIKSATLKHKAFFFMQFVTCASWFLNSPLHYSNPYDVNAEKQTP